MHPLSHRAGRGRRLPDLLLPATAAAQSAITGTVQDSGGGVLPGVIVEASSPALISKNARTAVIDEEGRYADRGPASRYLQGDLHLAGVWSFRSRRPDPTVGFTATVNAELRVGTLEGTVTVSGQSPTVDV